MVKAFASYHEAALAYPLYNFTCSVAAFARLDGRFARHLVELLTSPLAFGTDVLPSAKCALLRIIIGGVLSEWISNLHDPCSILRSTNSGRRQLKKTFIDDASMAMFPSSISSCTQPERTYTHLLQNHDLDLFFYARVTIMAPLTSIRP